MEYKQIKFETGTLSITLVCIFRKPEPEPEHFNEINKYRDRNQNEKNQKVPVPVQTHFQTIRKRENVKTFHIDSKRSM